MFDFFKMISLKKIIPLFCVLALSVVCFSYTIFEYFSIKENIRSGSLSLIQVKNQTELAVYNEKQFSVFDDQLEKLHAQGYVGEPKRLAWVEVLNETVEKLELPQVRFTLSPTINKADLNSEEDPYRERSNLSLTPMSLEMELMHERDFYDFIREYKSVAPGVFQVDDCEIKRIEENTTEKPIQLTAVCNITWLNYRDIRKDWEMNL